MEIQINNQPLSVKVYKGQRVVTFKDVDTAHCRPDGTSRKRFNDNRKHFIEGTDFFRVQPSEIRTVGVTSPNGAYVLTESGYLMLAKSFTDDLAWTVQRQLVNCYFRCKSEEPAKCKKPAPEQLTLETTEYHYFDKTYNGNAVLSIADINHFTGADKAKIYSALIKHGKIGTDYFHLDGATLAAFKAENPNFPKASVRWFIIVTKSGFINAMKLLNVKTETPKCFIEQKAEPKKNKEYAVVIGNTRIQSMIQKIKKELTAVDVLLDTYNRHNIPIDDMDALRKTLDEVGTELGCNISGLVQEKYRTTYEMKN